MSASVNSPAALDLQSASVYLGFSDKSKWLLEPNCPVPRCDLRAPGDKRPLWRWRRAALDAFLAQREYAPGTINPQEYS